MSKPLLPTSPQGKDWIKRIDPGWFRKLLLCVEYAMNNPRGDGNTILNQPGGTLRAVRQNRINDLGKPNQYTGPFAISIGEGKICVGRGFISRNGAISSVPEQTVAIPEKSGILCLHSRIDDESEAWTTPQYVIIDEPCDDKFPVGEIKVEGESVSFVQYPLTVAVIILTKYCPLAGVNK